MATIKIFQQKYLDLLIYVYDEMFDTHHTQHFVVIWTYDHPATTESRTDARAPYIMMCLMLLLTETCAFEARSERRRGGQHQDHYSQPLIMILYAVSKSLAQ